MKPWDKKGHTKLYSDILTEKYGINTRKLKKDTPFPNEIASFGCTLRCRLLLMLRNTTDVFWKTMNFDWNQLKYTEYVYG
jgi:hypothetical protein